VVVVAIVGLLAAGSGLLAAGDEVFRWRDADGVVHYADRTDFPEAEVVRLDPSPAASRVPARRSAPRCDGCRPAARCPPRSRAPGCSPP